MGASAVAKRRRGRSGGRSASSIHSVARSEAGAVSHHSCNKTQQQASIPSLRTFKPQVRGTLHALQGGTCWALPGELDRHLQMWEVQNGRCSSSGLNHSVHNSLLRRPVNPHTFIYAASPATVPTEAPAQKWMSSNSTQTLATLMANEEQGEKTGVMLYKCARPVALRDPDSHMRESAQQPKQARGRLG